MEQEKVSVAFRESPHRVEEIDEYADERGLSRSDALRELVAAGLDAREIEDLADEIDELQEQLAVVEILVRDQNRPLADRIFGRH